MSATRPTHHDLHSLLLTDCNIRSLSGMCGMGLDLTFTPSYRLGVQITFVTSCWGAGGLRSVKLALNNGANLWLIQESPSKDAYAYYEPNMPPKPLKQQGVGVEIGATGHILCDPPLSDRENMPILWRP